MRICATTATTATTCASTRRCVSSSTRHAPTPSANGPACPMTVCSFYHSYLGGSTRPPRHRGRSAAGRLLHAHPPAAQRDGLPHQPVSDARRDPPGAPVIDARRTLPGVARGRLLCEAYDVFQSIAPGSPISFEHAVYLAHALGRRDGLHPARCADCGAVVAADRCALREPRCLACDTPPPGR